MKILVVTQYYYPEPFRVDEICNELINRGNEVTVLTSIPNYSKQTIYDGYSNNNTIDVINGISVFRCKCHPRTNKKSSIFFNYYGFVRNSRKFTKQLEKECFDCIYVYQMSPVSMVIPAYKIFKKKKTPIFIYCLDIWPESVLNHVGERTLLFKYIRRLSIKLYNCAKMIGVTSPSFSDYFRTLGINKETVYLPQHSQDIKSVLLTKKIEKNRDVVNFLFAGNIGTSQNLAMIIKAFSKIQKENFLFHIVGDGSEYDNVKKLINELNLQKKCILYGRQPKTSMPIYYSIADICVLSLRREGFVSKTIPGKLQEYMSSGKFIIASIEGDAANLISDVGCGLVSSAESEDELIQNINLVLDHQIDFNSLGLLGREYYENNFTLAKHVILLEEFLKNMIKR